MTRPASGTIKFSDIANGQKKFNIGSWMGTLLAGKGSINSSVNLSNMYDTHTNSIGSRFISSNLAGSYSSFGDCVYVSGDGNTALVCGPYDGGFTGNQFPNGMSGRIGAVWVYVRSGNTWTEQQKIVPADTTHTFINYGGQLVDNTQNNVGNRGAISADGNTIAFMSSGENPAYVPGSPVANQYAPYSAIWIYTRSGTTWTQQTKIYLDRDINSNGQTNCIDLSGDGNTLVAGRSSFAFTAVADGVNGKVSVYTRSGTTWTQQTDILPVNWNIADSQYYRAQYSLATYNNDPRFGTTLRISADGQTLAVAGYADGNTYTGGVYTQIQTGAVWIYTRSGNTWTYQAKLIPTSFINQQGIYLGLINQGIDLSADGNTLAVSGYNECDTYPFTSSTKFNGSVYVFTRSGSTWTQEAKLVPTINIQASSPAIDYDRFISLGVSVNITADGNKIFALTSGFSGRGHYVFTRSGTTWTEQGSYARTASTISSNTSAISPGSRMSMSKNGKYGLIAEKQSLGSYPVY